MTRRIVVLSAGVSVPSSTRLLADRIGDAVRSAVGARGERAEVEVIELRELAVDLATALTTGGLASPALQAARDAVDAADGIVAVTPVFSASYSGLFKLFVDLLDPDALDGVPVLIAATAGTARHSLVLEHAMRPLFSYLRAVVVPTGVFAATEDFGAEGPLTERIGRAASQLAGLVVAERASVAGFVPEAGRPRAAAAPLTPFATLLQGHTG
ncbi:MAG: CE1759 family FMN reductase [Kineosporiaceae bacterium]